MRDIKPRDFDDTPGHQTWLIFGDRDYPAGRELALLVRLDAIERKVDRLMARLGPEVPEPLSRPAPSNRRKGVHYDPLSPLISSHLHDTGWDRRRSGGLRITDTRPNGCTDPGHRRL